MKLLYVLPKRSYFMHGRRGRVAHAIGLVSGFAAAGVEVTVISGPETASALSDCRVSRSIEVEEGGDGLMGGYQWTNSLLREIRQLTRQEEYDVVLARYAVSNASRLARLFRAIDCPLCCFEVNSLAYHQYHTLPNWLRELIRGVERRILSAADLVYVVSSSLVPAVRRPGAAKPLVEVVPNAADPQEQTVVGRTPPDEIVRFVYMGVFQQYYELELVVEAFQSLAVAGLAAELHFFGDGPQFDRVESSAEGRTDILFHGRYDLREVLSSDMLDSRTVLLLPNRGTGMSEIGSPIKLYEYMSFGLPIIASSVAQATEVLVDGESAIFYEPGDAKSLSGAMAKLFDQELRRRLASNVHSVFLREHTWVARMNDFKCKLESARQSLKS